MAERTCCATTIGDTHRSCPTTGHNEHGVAMCACRFNGRRHAFEPGESCSPERVIPCPHYDDGRHPSRCGLCSGVSS